MPLDFMTPSHQQRLMKIARLVIETARDEDMPLTDACVKHAADAQLSKDEIHRVKESINTAAVLAQRKRAKAGEGSADDTVQLVDGDAVIDRIFPSQIAKTAFAVTELPEETEHFDNLPAPTLKKVAAAEEMVKVGAAATKPAESYGELRNRAIRHRNSLALQAEFHKEAAFAARVDAERKIEAFVDRLSQTDAPPFAEIEKTASALCPDEGLSVAFDLVFRSGRLGALGQRRHDGSLVKYASVSAYAAEIEAIRSIRDSIGTALIHGLDAERLQAQVDRGDRGLTKIATEEGSKSGIPIVGGLVDSLDSATRSAVTGFSPKAAEKGGDEIKAVGSSVLQRPGSLDERLKREIGQDTMRASLADLQSNDPVVSKFKPDQVANAFNEIVALQPSIAQQPVALRAALRRHLVGDGDLTLQEAKQIKDFDRTGSGFVGAEAMGK